MAAERPEKQTVRALWVEEVSRADAVTPGESVPLYVTLPGARGGDIQALIDGGLLVLAETSAVKDIRSMRVVAIERSPDAVVALGKRFPGLKILDQPLESLLKSTGSFRWPEGEHHQLFRAQVLNFDLEEPLNAVTKDGQLWFPELALIRKLAVMHAAPPCVDWTLCLTLHGEMSWTQEGDKLACCFLAENFSRDPEFASKAKGVLGDALYTAIAEKPNSAKVRLRGWDEQQRVSMVLVPKRIAFDAHGEGWSVDTVENLRYGGSSGRAPMVTWVMRFRWEPRASSEPDTVYREALTRTLQRLGRIDANGVLHRGSG